jgi:hypothetical protein
MSDSACGSCNFTIEEGDNFCRRCGASAAVGVPAVRSSTSMTVWKPQASPIVKGAAVMAAGTIGQFIVRRAIGNLIGGGSHGRRRSILPIRARGDGLVDEAQIITETVMMRRVRIRRPG